MSMPAHHLKALHPKWSTADPEADLYRLRQCSAPGQSAARDHGPVGHHRIQDRRTDDHAPQPVLLESGRSGNQLPYLDEIQYRKGPSGIGRDLCTIAGDCDHMNLENPSTFVEAMTRLPRIPMPSTASPGVLKPWAITSSSTSRRTSASRATATRLSAQLFRDLRFRQALSYATDRDGIAQSIMKRPFLRGWAGGLYPGAPEFDKESVVYYPYDVDSAKALLAEIGLKDTNGDGVLNWTSGPKAGQKVVVALNCLRRMPTKPRAWPKRWSTSGAPSASRSTISSLDSATNQANDTQRQLGYEGHPRRAGIHAAIHNPDGPGPGHPDSSSDHREGDQPRHVLLDFEQKLIDIMTQVPLDVRRRRTQAVVVTVQQYLHRERLSTGRLRRPLRSGDYQAHEEHSTRYAGLHVRMDRRLGPVGPALVVA